ncbi:MAG: RDD family protein [Rickettsiales bacterium]|jgi:uncharacterized RDD family membrane protein YckC|nr:RDD family protein [Rickettsiales bacterium]
MDLNKIKECFRKVFCIGEGMVEEYQVSFAKPSKRFYAFLIDSAIVYSFIMIILFFVLRGEFGSGMDGNGTLSFKIDTDSNITEIQNDGSVSTQVVAGEKFRAIKLNNSAGSKEKAVREALANNKFCVYVIFCIPILYHITFLMTKKRATVGQQIFNIMVIKRNGKNLPFGDILSRVCMFMLSKALFAVPFGIIIPIFCTKERTTIYDFLTGTRVVEINKQ